ncbi:hypothetical protein KD146_01875 [Devosia sp. BSSL-BM10]|uniref:Uncharacterized protein n=1 Tax=Devosia litorisediminis TaxID=2829817 RepID=A0A942ICR3_9HYPH|nr:hypothetical protein [Devosia litorisediminis]MBS3847435.1 hypothetical protein [Devosia litorisediminis]
MVVGTDPPPALQSDFHLVAAIAPRQPATASVGLRQQRRRHDTDDQKYLKTSARRHMKEASVNAAFLP